METELAAPIVQAAALLSTHRLARVPLDHLPPDCYISNEAAAYTVQDLVHQRLTAGNEGPLAGHKIGCTTTVMQAYLGIHSPCAGGVFAAHVRHEQGTFSQEDYMRLGVECEIAVLLGASLTQASAPFNRHEVAGAISGCMAAIEVVEDRYRDYSTLAPPVLIADDFFAAGCVLGKVQSGFDPYALATVTATMQINGRPVGSGVGADVLGEPLDALVWLANHMATRGSALQAGSFVLLGSLVQTHWVRPGDEVVVQNEQLGNVHANFT